MSSELEMYKEQCDKLEKYLMDCMRLFDGHNATLIGGTCRAPSTLKKCIQHVLDNTPDLSKGGGYTEGAEYAYKDCIELLGLIADDTEKHLPKNKKGMELAAAYRTLGDGMIARMNIMLGGAKDA